MCIRDRSNAVKYTPEGGSVTLRLEIPGDGKDVHISVSDTGIGVPRQDQPYIFQRFFQSSQTAGKKEGTGIGLYLVKTYTELHGGSVLLTSEENRGTTIILNLPVVSLEQMSTDTVPEPIASEKKLALSGSETVTSEVEPVTFPAERALSDTDTARSEAPLILIVDDTPEITEFIYQMLHANYRCRVAENGKIGVELAMELLPDLIIADVMMPVMDGFEMVHRLKKHIPTSTIPIILLTAKSDKKTELESIQLNIEAFIPKPFEPDILLSRVQQLLAAREMHEAKARIEALAAPKEIEAVSYLSLIHI